MINDIFEFKKEMRKKRYKLAIAAGLAVLFAIMAVNIAISIYMEIIQLKEIHDKLPRIFITNTIYKLLFSLMSFILIFILISISNVIIKRNLKAYMLLNSLPVRRLPNFLISVIIALVGAFLSRDVFYNKAITFFNAVDFGLSDPIFSKDIGYYIFRRPFLLSLYNYISGLWLFIIIYTALYYLAVFFVMYRNITFGSLKIKPILKHNLVNISCFFIIKAFSYVLLKENILYSSVVNATGAGFVETKVWLKYYYAAPFLIVLIVLMTYYFIWKGRFRHAAYSIAAYPAAWLLVLIVSLIVQGFIVKPNEFKYEGKYLGYNMHYTRKAFGIDKIKNIEISSVRELTPEIINRNPGTMNNIRVVDYRATLDTNIQLQSNTLFYNFVDGDIINYKINGKDTPIFITAREIDKSRIPGKQNYIRNTFQYTHGYGVVINPINRLSPQGQAEFILSGLRMTSKDPNLKVTEPRIYYGELTDDHVIVNAKNINEIDYDGNSETRYNGTGGIKLGILNKLLFALKYGDFNMLVSGYVTPDSKLLLNRQIVLRAQKGVPFLKIDNDPYIILTKEGRLLWVIDAYTITSNYPFSQRQPNHNGINYIRNSVKVTVDAYNGEVKYYIIDKKDPIIQVYNKAYPGIFIEKPLPSDVLDHMKYPEFLFRIQTEILKKYHLDPLVKQNINSFYTNQDLWNIAQYQQSFDTTSMIGIDDNDATEIEPYYNMIKLPVGEGAREELILMRPFTPSGNKHNMVSWLAVRNSADNYGEMILFRYPKNTNILGPYQVEANINSIDIVSKNMTLWSQGGSEVFKGSLLVIPIENSVLYVEPIYIKASGPSAIPQVRQIVVGYQKGEEFKAGIGTNLEKALTDLFSNKEKTAPGAPDGNQNAGDKTDVDGTGNTIEDIKEKYNQIKKQLDELGKLIENLE